MKRSLFALCAIASISLASAQEHGHTLSGGGAFTGGVTFVDGATFPIVGGRGGVLLDHRFLIGGGGASAWGNTTGSQGGSASLDYGYGGLLLGWWPMADAAVRPTFEVIIGGGGYQCEEAVEGGLYRIDKDDGFAYSGELGLQIRLHDHIRLSVAAGWRGASTDEPLMDGGSVMAGLWFGEF